MESFIKRLLRGGLTKRKTQVRIEAATDKARRIAKFTIQD